MLIEVQIGRDISEEELERLATRLRQLLLCDFERQVASRLAELHSGGEILNPLRISVDLRYPPAEKDLGCGQSLVIPEGQPLSRAESIAFVRQFVPPELVEDVLIEGCSWHDACESPDLPVVG